MTVQSSDVTSLFAAVIISGLFFGFVAGLLLERSTRRKAPAVPMMPYTPNAGLLLHQAPLMVSKSNTSGGSRHTAQFGDVERGEACQSLDRGEGSLERVAIEEPEPEIEAVPYLSAGLSAETVEQVPYLDTAADKPSHTGSLAPTIGAESQEGSFQSDDAVTLSVMDCSQAAPYLTSRAAVDAAEQVPYLNAASGKPYYMDNLAPTTACAESQEGSFQSDDAVALGVMDCSQAAPYLDGTPTSRAAVPYEAVSAHTSPWSPRQAVPVPYLQ